MRIVVVGSIGVVGRHVISRLLKRGHEVRALIRGKEQPPVEMFPRLGVEPVQGAPARSIYNVVDDEPVTYRELYHYVAAQTHSPAPQPGNTLGLPSLACRNTRVKAALHWSPAYPTYRSGLA